MINYRQELKKSKKQMKLVLGSYDKIIDGLILENQAFSDQIDYQRHYCNHCVNKANDFIFTLKKLRAEHGDIIPTKTLDGTPRDFSLDRWPCGLFGDQNLNDQHDLAHNRTRDIQRGHRR